MGETDKERIVINDLLSFLTCKAKCMPKDRLLSSISEYYSKNDIAEAHKILLSVLPIKKSTRHGRCVKHPDPLIAIYECIQLIPKGDLPLFLCKNLNNVPNLSNAKKLIKEENFNEENINIESDTEMNEAICRKEQKLMRSQISQMFSIITELKVGLQKYIENQKIHSKEEIIKTNKKSRSNDGKLKNLESTEIQQISFSNYEEHSQVLDQTYSESEKEDGETSKLNGFALLQKLIDEDDQSLEMETIEKVCNFFIF